MSGRKKGRKPATGRYRESKILDEVVHVTEYLKSQFSSGEGERKRKNDTTYHNKYPD
jgi:hypothetical protein